MKNIVILGGGFGGLTAANELAKNSDCKVKLIDKNPGYYVGLNKLWVMTGKRTPEECKRSYGLLKNKNITFINSDILAIDFNKKTVKTSGDLTKIPYDYLVISMGADLEPGQVTGSESSLNLYSMDGSHRINKELKKMKKGKIAIVVCRTPFKCPPAPYEAAFLIEGYLRQLGNKEKVVLSFYTPEPQPMPIAGKEAGNRIKQFLVERNIEYFPEHKIMKIGKDHLEFENGKNTNADMIITVPAHKIPKALKPLTDESGWIAVNKNTLETKFKNVFAIGDCNIIKLANGKPLPKAGIFAEEEAKVVAHNIVAEIKNSRDKISFNGKGYCFVETGDGKAVYANGDFFAEPEPRVIMYDPSESYLQQKIEFEKKRTIFILNPCSSKRSAICFASSMLNTLATKRINI